MTMQLSALFLLAALSANAASSAQNTVSFTGKDVPLEQVFAAVKRQTGYTFVYYSEVLQGAHRVTIDVKGLTVEEFLEVCLKDQPLTYKVIGQTVMIAKKEVRPVTNGWGTEPLVREIKGRITNNKGEPLAGATVIVKGSGKGTLTDEKGAFTLKNIPATAILGISFTGYIGKEVALKGQISLTVTLDVATNSLDQVKIIAYGTTSQRLSTGDVTTIKSEQIEEQPVSDFLAAMEGRVPGMTITQQTGVPGGAYSVQIRGQNSIGSGNDPFYVVDGVPYSSQLIPNNGGAITGGGSPLNYINPLDIESIEALKDADATAIYGSRGANGVVLITTKKGKIGDMVADANFYEGVGSITRRMSLLNLPQYLEMRHEAFANDGDTPGLYDYDVNGTWDTTRSTDWQKVFIGGKSRYTNAQLTLSGGNASTQYLVGGTYHRETTVFPGNFADQKASVHFNLTSTSNNNKLRFELTGNYTNDNNNLLYGDLTSQAFLSPDAPPLYNKDGSLNWANSTWTNPMSNLAQKYNLQVNNLVSNAVLDYRLLAGLDIKINAGYTLQTLNDIYTTPIAYFDPAYNVTTGSASFTNNHTHSWITEPQIIYKHQFGNGNLNALVGTTIEDNVMDGQIINGSGYTSDALLESLQGAAVITQGSVTNTEYKYNALFGRVGYNWADKYLLNVNARRDGSSRFGPGNQFGNFGSLGAAWIFTKERFVQDHMPLLSFGKLRFSYGTSGNDQIGDYQYLSLYNFTTGIPYQGATGTYPVNLNNPNYSWELNKKLEGGLELGFLKDRILLISGYYRNRSSNELLGNTLPDITGFTGVIENLPALVQNTGWEFVLNTININSKNFRWTSSLNLTVARNKLVSFPSFSSSAYASTFVLGQPLHIVRAYHSLGVNDTSGIYQFADSKGNATYTPDYVTDRTETINLNPAYYGGFQNSFSYKGFRLDFLFQFVKQTGANYLFANSVAPGMSGYFNMPSYVLNRWQKPGDHRPIEQFTQNYGGAAYAAYQIAQQSNIAYSDASFIRLKNLSFSYTLPAAWSKKARIQNCRIYVQGQNLLTITKFKGMDPENQSVYALPPLRILTGGMQIAF
jgi:TonB-linked SusC/RagA family outer membrane protein